MLGVENCVPTCRKDQSINRRFYLILSLIFSSDYDEIFFTTKRFVCGLFSHSFVCSIVYIFFFLRLSLQYTTNYEFLRDIVNNLFWYVILLLLLCGVVWFLLGEMVRSKKKCAPSTKQEQQRLSKRKLGVQVIKCVPSPTFIMICLIPAVHLDRVYMWIFNQKPDYI